MKDIFIITGTVTHAMRAKELLKQKGYFAEIKRTKDKNEKYGCGYGVYVRADNLNFIKEFLLGNGVKIIEITVGKG